MLKINYILAVRGNAFYFHMPIHRDSLKVL